MPQNPRARKIRDNFGSALNRTTGDGPAQRGGDGDPADASADASPARARALWGAVRKQASFGAGGAAERDAAPPTAAGEVEAGATAPSMEGGQGAEEEEEERGRRFRWVVRVASRVSSVGKKAKGRLERIVSIDGDDDLTLPGQDGDM